MAKLTFILATQWKEFLRKWKLNVVILVSLVFSFMFIIIFSGKLLTITELKQLSRLQHVDNSIEVRAVFSESASFNELETAIQALNYDKVSYVSNYMTTFKKDGQSFSENFTVFEGERDYFFHFKHFQRELADDEVALSDYLARKYHLNVNDTIQINEKWFKVGFIFQSYQFEKRFIVASTKHIAPVSKIVSVYALVHLLALPDEALQQLGANDTLQARVLFEVNRASEKSLTLYILFIVAFSLVFLVLCLTNCLLAFKGKMTNLVKNLSIKLLYGLNNKGILAIVLWENLMLSLVAFHLAYVGLVLFNDKLPLFFTFRADYLNYGVALSFIMVCITVYSSVLMRKLSRVYIVDSLKGEVRAS